MRLEDLVVLGERAEFSMDRLSTQNELIKVTILILQVVFFCVALALSCTTLADSDGYGPLCAEIAIYLTGTLTCGVIAFRLLGKGARLACGLFLLVSLVWMLQVLSWCWHNALHPPHWKELASLGNEADKACDLHDWEKAEHLYKTIRDKEKSGYFALSHSSNELTLAYVLEQERKFHEAEQVYLQALHTMEQTHDRRSYKLVTCVQNLAIFYQDQKRYSEAEPLFKRALQLHKQDDGTWESMLCREDYAQLLRESGRALEARALEKEAKAIRSRFPADAQ